MKKLYLNGVGVFTLFFSAAGFAYTVHENERVQVDLTLDAMYGAFHSQRTYDPLGATNANGPGSVAWQEGVAEYGAEFVWNVSAEGATLAGRISGMSTATFGDGDAAGFTNGTERKNDIEDAWLRWRSGNSFAWLGENGLEISAGRQAIGVGDGFLLYGDLVSFGKGSLYPGIKNRGGAYYLAGRSAFANTAVISLGGNEGMRADLMWIKSDNDIQDKVEMLVANAEYVMPEATIGVTYLHGLEADSGVKGMDSVKDGMDIYSLRAQGNAGVEDLFLSAEYVYQDFAGVSGSENAWYVEGGWSFSQHWGQPTVHYRHSRFSPGYDPLFYGFSRGFGTWYQGEVAANYAGPLSTNTSIDHVNVMLTPQESVAVGVMLFNYRDNRKQAPRLDGQEANVFVDWAASPYLNVIPLLGIYKAKDGGTQLGTNKHNLYGQILFAMSF